MPSSHALAGVAAALLATAAHAQDGAIDMTGMGIYAQEEAVMEAARERPAAKRSARPVARRKSGRTDAENCAILRANLARLSAAEVRLFRLGCK